MQVRKPTVSVANHPLAAAIRADCSKYRSNDQRLAQAAHRRVTRIRIDPF